MGQQQLLLVILVTIIVGVATVVAINVFGTSAENANRDAVRQDILSIASAAQGWYIKPVMLAGGGGSFTDITFKDINFPADSIDDSNTKIAINQNATYEIQNPQGDGFDVTAYPASDEKYNGDMKKRGSYTFGTAADKEITAHITKHGLNWVQK
jgi:hypothetical protein